MLDGGETAVYVSGEMLRSKVPAAKLLQGQGATYCWGSYVLSGEFRVHGLGAKDIGYASLLNVRMCF